MTPVYLALGSNLGDSRANIAQALKLLETSVKHIKQAPIYTSKAVGYTDQPDFLNTAVSGQTDLSAPDLLKFTAAVEQQVGRAASFHWGPREIDIDIIFYGVEVMRTEKLTLPHPRFAERDFVLQPLNDLDPALVDPVSGQTVRQLLATVDLSERSILNNIDEKP
jgi:2-amino-4-hydroxy-6-hydroxymethyldihydropteridine diphosphokinase